MRDTTSEAVALQLTAIRAMHPAARLRQAIDLSEQMRRLAVAGLHRRHPELSERQLVARLSEIRDERTDAQRPIP